MDKAVKKRMRQRLLPVVFLLALISIAIGVISGEAAAVWRKASVVCLECIGIG